MSESDYALQVIADLRGYLCAALEAAGLRERLAAVEALHYPVGPTRPRQQSCANCEQLWPCETRRALGGAG